MSDNKMSDIIKTSLEGIKGFTDMDTIMGSAILTPSGVTVIPVSKISIAFASGGVDYGSRRTAGSQNFGGGGGTGVTITPVAFLTVGTNGAVNLLPLNEGSSGIDRVSSIIENAPKIIEKIKGSLS